MGVEFEVNNLEEMCYVMCDNVIPVKKKLTAEWGQDYDFRENKIYTRPVCPECKEPIWKYDDGYYHCLCCGKNVEVTQEDMLNWFKKREETKIEYKDCPKLTTKDGKHTTGCGGKDTVETKYMRNPITLKWQVMGGRCKQCGMKYIV